MLLVATLKDRYIWLPFLKVMAWKEILYRLVVRMRCVTSFTISFRTQIIVSTAHFILFSVIFQIQHKCNVTSVISIHLSRKINARP